MYIYFLVCPFLDFLSFILYIPAIRSVINFNYKHIYCEFVVNNDRRT